MKLIIESKTFGRFVVMYDKEDDAIVQGHTWHIRKDGDRFYAQTNITLADGKYKTKSLHSLIAGTPEGMHTDHINGDTLDNRRQNLRVCTHAENQGNSGKQKNNTSGFVGVVANGNGWKARVSHERKRIYLGYFKIKEDAARARDRGVVKLRNLVTPRMLNFPHEFNFVKQRFK